MVSVGGVIGGGETYALPLGHAANKTSNLILSKQRFFWQDLQPPTHCNTFKSVIYLSKKCDATRIIEEKLISI